MELTESVGEGVQVPQDEGERETEGLLDSVGEKDCETEGDLLAEEVMHPETVPLNDGEPLLEGDKVAVWHSEVAPVELTESVGLLDSVTESVALSQPLVVPEGVTPGLPVK